MKKENGEPCGCNHPEKAQTPEQEEALLPELRALANTCGEETSKHDLVRVLVAACIEAGVNEGKQIVALLTRLNCNPKHVGMTLKNFAHPDRSRGDWFKGSSGAYRLHPLS
ncbi:hypothetical protein [Qipengyuania nanhaisediminis]|uniref:Uncharacterized protein n=1 Tax=Qipengyuania nanhaisediminis TaxID=604088 RepID=A0A1I5KAA6_9SPHN|nr:hypothetical protein [Qipengyuania nanhaisediminis]SFO81673.1 hypothetical protein SAMN04488060_0018 [Qipengyuania nanhaisediminis]